MPNSDFRSTLPTCKSAGRDALSDVCRSFLPVPWTTMNQFPHKARATIRPSSRSYPRPDWRDSSQTQSCWEVTKLSTIEHSFIEVVRVLTHKKRGQGVVCWREERRIKKGERSPSITLIVFLCSKREYKLGVFLVRTRPRLSVGNKFTHFSLTES